MGVDGLGELLGLQDVCRQGLDIMSRRLCMQRRAVLALVSLDVGLGGRVHGLGIGGVWACCTGEPLAKSPKRWWSRLTASPATNGQREDTQLPRNLSGRPSSIEK